MAICTLLNEFKEFKNTDIYKKHIEEEENKDLNILFYKNKDSVVVKFSKKLVLQLRKRNLTRFKMLINERTRDIALVYDNSTNCLDIDSVKQNPNGTVQLCNKYITHVMNEIINGHKGTTTTSITYECSYNLGFEGYYCKIKK